MEDFNKENLIDYNDFPEKDLYELFDVPSYNFLKDMSTNKHYPAIYWDDESKGAKFGIGKKEFNTLLDLGYHINLICWYEDDFFEERQKELLVIKDNRIEKLIDAKGLRKDVNEDTYIGKEVYSRFLPKITAYYKHK